MGLRCCGAGLTSALDGVPAPDVAATVGVLRHLVHRYVQRVRTTMPSEDGTPVLPAPPGVAGDGGWPGGPGGKLTGL